MKTNGQLNSTAEVNLNNYSSYKDSVLAQVFGETVGGNITTKWVLESGNYYLKRNGLVVQRFQGSALASNFNLESLTLLNTGYSADIGAINVYGRTAGNIALQEFGFKLYPDINFVANFQCCPPVDPCANDRDCDGIANSVDNCPDNANFDQLDSDGNGVGDVCTICEIPAAIKSTYETRLKEFLNVYQHSIVPFVDTLYGERSVPSTSLNDSSDVSVAIRNLVNDSNLLQHFQSFRNSYQGFTNPFFSVQPISYSRYIIKGVYSVNSIGVIEIFLFDTTNNRFFDNQYNPGISYSTIVLVFREPLPNINTFNAIILDPASYGLHNIDYTRNDNSVINDFFVINNEVSFPINSAYQSYNIAQGFICEFLNDTSPIVFNQEKTIISKSYNKNITFFKNNISNKLVVDPQSPQICSTCVPQPVAPVPCDDAKTRFLNFLQLDAGEVIDSVRYFNSARIVGYSIEEGQFDDFCKNNFAYISDSYIYYLNKLFPGGAAISTYDRRYRSLGEFGDTYLHYGFNGIKAVIDKYSTYYTSYTGAADDLKNWNEWVAADFKTLNTVCPPAPLSDTYSIDIPNDTDETCEHLITNIKETFSAENYNNFLQTKRKQFIEAYIKQAMNSVVETLDMTYFDKQYQYTLYYYDQAGNLTQTVAPEGVKRFSPTEIDSKNAAIETFKVNNSPLNLNPAQDPNLQPAHTFKTQYRYNSLNQLVWQQTPDGGTTRFAYDELGRIIASQNAKQLPKQRMSYTVYDNLGRIMEAGEIGSFAFNASNPSASINYSISANGRLIQQPTPVGATNGNVNGFDSSLPKTQVTHTIYDEDPEYETNLKASTLFTTNNTIGFDAAFNNRNRVTGVFYHENYNPTTPLIYDNAIFYNYDVHGNVKELVNYYTPLKVVNCVTDVINPATGQLNDCEAHIKRVVYNYDLISGNVNHVTFQPNKADQFKHRYNYDADNRIVNVETSPDGVIWEKDAKYQYYAHGPLARVELGNKQVQGIDYAYTLQGWLKTVNGENIADSQNDLGKDGLLTGTTKTKDAFGYSLNYYEGDYKAIVGDTGDATFKPLMVSRNATGASLKNLYNGNIKQMTTAIRKSGDQLLDIQKNNYTYDQLNRIKEMSSLAFNPATMSSKASYASSYSYDRNGNLQTLKNSAIKNDGTIAPMDDFTYEYAVDSNNNKINRLNKVFDAADDIFTETGIDIKKNIIERPSYNVNNVATHNYIYDAIGQLTEDKSEGLKIEWRVDGKVSKVTNSKTSTIITFDYDGLGNRIAKSVQKDAKVTRTQYARDAQGNVLGVYEEKFNAPTTAVLPNLYLNSYNVTNTQIKKATNGIYVSSDGSSSEVTATGNLNLIAANEIVLSPGFTATSGGVFLAELKTVETTNNSIYTLKEHHLYGSSRLGLEEKDLVVYKRIVAPLLNKSSIVKNANLLADTSKTVLNLPPFPVFRDYSLKFLSTTVATWPMNLAGATPLEADLTNFQLKTRIKLLSTSIANDKYLISSLTYKGTKTEQGNNSEVIVPIAGIVTPCIVVNTVVTSVIVRSTSCTTPPVISANPIQLLANNENGYIEYKLVNTPRNNGISIGYTIDSQIYGFRVANELIEDPDLGTFLIQTVLYAMKGIDEVLVGPIAGSNYLKIERNFDTNNQPILNYYLDGNLVDSSPITVSAASSSLSFGPGTRVSFFKAVKYNNTPVIKELTNNLKLVLEKDNNGFTPKLVVDQYIHNTTTNQYSKRSFVASAGTYITSLLKEFDIDFNSSINGLGYFNINGNPLSLSAMQWTAETSIASIPVIANNNQIGGTFDIYKPIGFDMCYFNYGVNTSNKIANVSFGFDLQSGDPITIVPVSNLGHVINANVVTRVLGPCLSDADADGIYDIYEDVAIVDDNLANDDTDQDGTPNYLDADDDGDGILTINEGAVNGPNTLTASTNTDVVAPTDNPNVQTDVIPNYLDADDDGDGYATWETYEGGSGLVNSPTPGAAYTLNSDNEGDVNYLDATNGNYPAALASTQNIFLSLVGDKRYELSNHLGNVLVVINDKKIPTLSANGTVLNYFNADVLSYSDYYPFGQLVPNRHGNSSSYRYGFNGKENDNEIMGEGNFEDYGMRMYNPRIGRFFNVDPLTKDYPELTPYQFASNTPIAGIDLDGLEVEVVVHGKPVGYTLMHVYGENDTGEVVAVEVYTAVIQYRDPKGKVTKLEEFFVTRDGWFNIGTDINKKSILVNRSSDPDPEFNGKLIIERIDKDYYGPGATAYTISNIPSKIDPKYNSTYLNDGKPGNSLNNEVDKIIRENGTAKGAQFHPGGYYEGGDYENTKTLKLAGTFGCYGIVHPSQVAKTEDEAWNTDLSSIKPSNVEMKNFDTTYDKGKKMEKKDFGKNSNTKVKIQPRKHDKVIIE